MTTFISNKNLLAFVIEDDDDAATIFAAAMIEAELEPEIIQTGQLALTRLRETIPALIVLDLHLPHVSGVQILQQIRADDRLSDTRVMLVTADSRLAEIVEDEADLVLLKPVSFTQISELTKRIYPVF